MISAPEVLDLTLPRLAVKALAWGPADGRLMLCLHGFPDSAHGWRHVGPLLADAGSPMQVFTNDRGYSTVFTTSLLVSRALGPLFVRLHEGRHGA